MDRRSFLLGGAAATLGAVGTAHAQDPIEFMLEMQSRKASWGDDFDGTSRHGGAVLSSEPMLSPETASYIEQALQHHAAIVARGGWGTVPTDVALQLGNRHANVPALRQRLMASGDLQQNAGLSDVFDSYVDQAVKRFQLRHGIIPDGVVGAETLRELNVPAQARMRQLEINLVRVRSMSGFLGDRLVMCNIPAASTETVEGGRVVSRHTSIVGKVDRETPVLASRIHELNFNPFWTVPRSIIRRDLIPKMQKEPNYLTDNNIRIYRTWNGVEELDPRNVNWFSDEAESYMFRQDPGEVNSLGSVKINFHNPHQVYFHDTPTKNLFGEDYRFLSSGCVRVQNVREMITWLMRPMADLPRARIDQVIRTGERIDVRITYPVPVYTQYVTAWANSGGVVNFREDIYNRDGLSLVAQN